ncbi:hypothetical protein [Providencia sp.]|uniref:hypothetical protein n=1 Tax=Providencia sp. TaxID=589 RepID=UPI0033421DD0
MSRNIKKARIPRISKVKADRGLEERVTALEKQLTDMQAAMSCNGDHMGFILEHMTKMNDAVSVKL